MPDVPRLPSRHPAYVRRHSHARIVVTFPGHGWRRWQVSAMVASLPLFALNPAFAGLAALMPVMWSRFLRQRSAPEVEVRGDALVIRREGRSRTLPKVAVHAAGARRQDGAWVLVVETDHGEVTVGDTGAPPAELQWMAELIGAWKRDADRAPDRRAWLVANDLGEQVLVGGPPWRPVELVAAVWMFLVAIGVGAVFAWGAPGDDSVLHWLSVMPVAAVLGHFYGAHLDGRTEVRLRPQSVHVHTTWPRESRHSIALQDIASVEATAQRTRLVLGGGEQVDIHIKDRGLELAAAIEERRAALAVVEAGQEDDGEREARRLLERLSRRAGTGAGQG